jgi:hypothetical protein
MRFVGQGKDFDLGSLAAMNTNAVLGITMQVK